MPTASPEDGEAFVLSGLSYGKIVDLAAEARAALPVMAAEPDPSPFEE
jgi:hypothetical protein